jgi:peptidoglycan/xylan/chitin deacetylase (PgdA/CDA1 family)
MQEPVIALTFDDGPNAEFTPKVLNLLRKHNAKATFFCIGKHIESNPEILKRILTEGHVVGNHSYGHTNNNGFLSTKNLIVDMTKTIQLVKKLTHLELKLFRPPFGVTNPNIAKAVSTLNLQSIGWSIRSLDTIAKEPNKVFQKIREQITNGDVILLHDTNELTLEVLVQLLPFLEEKNIRTVTVDTLFNIKAYAS